RQINALSGAIVGLFPVLPAQRTQANIESAFGLKPGSLAPVALRLLNAKGIYGGHLMPSGVHAPPGQFGNLTIADPLNFNDNQLNTNADYLWSDSNRISMKLFRGIGDVFDPFGGQGAQSLGSGLTAPFHNYLASLSDTWTVTPSITNEARLGYDRNLGGAVPKEPVKLSDIGMARFNEPLFPGIPYIITNDPIANFGGIGTNYDQASATNTYQFADTTAWVRGRHSLSAGIEYRRYQVNASNNFASRGFLQFASFKDFLTGGPIVTSFVGTGVTVRDFRARDVAAYMQDDYKVTSRLTLNIGLRYDYMGPSVDRRDRLANFDPSRLDADTLANAGSGLAAAFVLPASFKSSTIQGTPGVDRSTFTNLDKTNFAPRMGFSWDPFGDGKTAIRGGYGIYYIRISNQTQLQLMTALPFFETSNLSNPGTTLANPFPELPLPWQFPMIPAFPRFQGYNAAGSPIFSASLLTLNPIQRNLETPYAEQYNFTMQRELPAHWVLEAGYTGSQGVHLLNSLQVNQALLASANTPIRGLTANSTANYNARVTVSGLSPSGLNEVTNAAHSSFNAFVFTVNRRVSKMFFQGAYTFSRSIDNNSGSATQDLGTQIGNQLVPWMGRGLSDFDRTHRVTATYEYDFGSFGQGLAKAISGGWILGGLTTFQSAVPVAFSCATCTASTNVYGLSGSILMPDVIGNLKQLSKGGDPRNYLDPGTNAFNTGILAAPAVFTNGQVLATNLNPQGGPGNQTYVVGSNGSGTFLAQLFGTLPRNPGIRGPFQQQWDVYVAKVIPIREKLKLRFDGQFFNLFNHTVFAAPSGAVGSSAFGRISSTVTQPRIIQIAGRLEF
ncbi:MAG TPA: hypothetical protein VKY31_09030, partial [Terriglobia bacterium]|nr:hypothetical protein [Terriglobia bacterium]